LDQKSAKSACFIVNNPPLQHSTFATIQFAAAVGTAKVCHCQPEKNNAQDSTNHDIDEAKRIIRRPTGTGPE
jgi:hypothetical protein